jgi:hypothetical protein
MARSEKDLYSDGQARPLGGYLGAMAANATAVGTLAGVARLTRHEIPDGLSVGDVVLGAVATATDSPSSMTP